MKKGLRVFSLFSGGLDSLVATFLMKNLGYTVVPIFFETPFYNREKPLKYALKNGLKLKIIDFTNEFLQILKNPKYGFGKYLNPCIDCHAKMFSIAFSMVKNEKVDFLISGEVLCQRNMSQRRDSLNAVSKLSGVSDYIVRPLSQKLLIDTLPIREGWVKKDDMLSISGRSRKQQIKLAKDFGIKAFPSSSGGCLLTEKQYSKKVNDLISYNQLNLLSVKMLNYGRHFRLSDKAKLILGRNDIENRNLWEIAKKTDIIILQLKRVAGPTGFLLQKEKKNKQDLKLAGDILTTFCKKLNSNFGEVLVKQFGKPDFTIITEKLSQIEEYRINRR